MHGNVWEWCLDDFHQNYQGVPLDGSAWIDKNDSDFLLLLRGGSWYDDPRNCRSATRCYHAPDNHDDNIGFRVVCEIPRTL
jgi:formylglycine-generating enzyme required for sulfatase activity